MPTGVPRCKNCGWDFHEEKAARQSRKLNKKSSLILWVLGVFFLLAICGVSYGLAIGAVKTIGPVATPTRTTEENAWYACTLFVEKQLKVAAFDAQRYNSSGVILLDNSKYRVDVDYAKLTTTFTCFLQDHTNGNWELINLVAPFKDFDVMPKSLNGATAALYSGIKSCYKKGSIVKKEFLSDENIAGRTL